MVASSFGRNVALYLSDDRTSRTSRLSISDMSDMPKPVNFFLIALDFIMIVNMVVQCVTLSNAGFLVVACICSLGGVLIVQILTEFKMLMGLALSESETRVLEMMDNINYEQGSELFMVVFGYAITFFSCKGDPGVGRFTDFCFDQDDMLPENIDGGISMLFEVIFGLNLLASVRAGHKFRVLGAGGSLQIAMRLIAANLILTATFPLSLVGFNSLNTAVIAKIAGSVVPTAEAADKVAKENLAEKTKWIEEEANIHNRQMGYHKNGDLEVPMFAKFVFIFFGAAFAASGIFVYKLGSDALAMHAQAGPEEAFKFLGEACVISEVRSSSRKITYWTGCDPNGEDCERKEVCKDFFSYEFTWNETGAVAYAADVPWDIDYDYKSVDGTFLEEPHERTGTGAALCEDSEDYNWKADYMVGGVFNCWKPKMSVEEVKDVGVYECWNDACIKLNDPALEAAKLFEDGEKLKNMGAILIVIGLMFFGCTAKLVFCSKVGDRGDGVEEQGQRMEMVTVNGVTTARPMQQMEMVTVNGVTTARPSARGELEVRGENVAAV